MLAERNKFKKCKILHRKVGKTCSSLYVHPWFSLVRDHLGVVIVAHAKNKIALHGAKAENILLRLGRIVTNGIRVDPVEETFAIVALAKNKTVLKQTIFY